MPDGWRHKATTEIVLACKCNEVGEPSEEGHNRHMAASIVGQRHMGVARLQGRELEEAPRGSTARAHGCAGPTAAPHQQA